MVVAQLAEHLLLTPEIHGSNPDIIDFYLLSTARKNENKEKEAVNGAFKKRHNTLVLLYH